LWKSRRPLLRGEGRTQAEVAAMVGVDERTIKRWESGDITGHCPDTSAPDCRVKIATSEHGVIRERVAAWASERDAFLGWSIF
jgi:DNA-binding XRE family transcriptional regulator